MFNVKGSCTNGIVFVLVVLVGGCSGFTGPVHHSAISPDGKYFAQSTGFGITIYDVETGKIWKKLNGGAVSNLKFSADSKFLASGGLSELTLWDCNEGKALATWNGKNRWSFIMVFSQDSSLLAARDDTSLRIWETSTQKLVLTIPLSCEMDNLTFSPDGKLIAVAGNVPKEKEPRGHDIYIWEVPSGKLLTTLQGPEHCFVQSMAFSPDGEYLATGISVQASRLWEISSRKSVWKQEVGNVGSDILTFSPDGKQVIVGGYQTLCRVDTQNGKILNKYELPGTPMTSLTANAKQGFLYVTKADSVYSIDLDTGKEQRLLSK